MNKKYKLKGWVITSIYLFSIGVILSSLFIVGKTLQKMTFSADTLSYVYRDIISDTIPVMQETKNTQIEKPYSDEKVSIIKDYYDKESDQKTQENSLIVYQNTYMPNTGVLYGSDNEFDVYAVLDGTIESITPDEIMGNIVRIRHSNNLTTVYECLNTVNVLVGETIHQGETIGTSGINKIETSKENMLLFEVEYNGEHLNPNKFYEMNINDLQ